MTETMHWRAAATIVIVGDRRLARSAELAHLLSDRFDVVTYDGDEPAELEALIGTAEGPTSIVGVATGAGLALETAARLAVDRVALCEPLVDRGRLAIVGQPTLLVSCDEGGARPRRVARALWRLLPDCQLRELGCDEADPFVVAELLEDFLAVPALAGAV
jgi:hypothetical protein